MYGHAFSNLQITRSDIRPSSSSSRLQAIPLFRAYRLGTSILGMIWTAMGHYHYDFELVLWLGLEPRSPMCKASMLTNYAPQVTHKVACQPGDCVWSLYCSSGVCVGMYGLAYSLYHPEGTFKMWYINIAYLSDPENNVTKQIATEI